jgi:predicted GIY-YIG superfamily endonuclease
MMRGTGFVYRLFAADGTLLYIGSSGNPEQRIKTHKTNSSGLYGAEHIRTRTVQHTIVEYPTRADAERAERAAIYNEAPLYNRMHNHKRFARVKRTFFPVDHEVWLPGHAGRIMQRMAEVGATFDEMYRAIDLPLNQLSHIAQGRMDRIRPHELRAVERYLGMGAGQERVA